MKACEGSGQLTRSWWLILPMVEVQMCLRWLALFLQVKLQLIAGVVVIVAQYWLVCGDLRWLDCTS